MPRKIIQITAVPSGTTGMSDTISTNRNVCALFALCNDGTVWKTCEGKWREMGEIPQDGYEEPNKECTECGAKGPQHLQDCVLY